MESVRRVRSPAFGYVILSKPLWYFNTLKAARRDQEYVEQTRTRSRLDGR